MSKRWSWVAAATLVACAERERPADNPRDDVAESERAVQQSEPAPPRIEENGGGSTTRALPRRGADDNSEAPPCTGDEPGRSYTSRSVDECSRLRFACVPEAKYFSDSCGCGCETK